MKIIKYTLTALCVLFILWVGISWADIVADNCDPNPQHYDWNFFVVMFPQNKEVEEEPAETPLFDTSVLEGWCGQPEGQIRMVGGWLFENGLLADENGNLWEWNGEIDETDFCLLWIDDCGTPQVEDDFIVKVWVENY